MLRLDRYRGLTGDPNNIPGAAGVDCGAVQVQESAATKGQWFVVSGSELPRDPPYEDCGLAINGDGTKHLAICAHSNEGRYDCWNAIDSHDVSTWTGLPWDSACEAARKVLIAEQVIAQL